MNKKTSIDDLTEMNVELIARMERATEFERTRGERIADAVARTVGSWTFLIIQSTLLVLWIIANLIGAWQHWDPYPFILLNLALSFQAAYATPIIMMSQNRHARIQERRNHLDLQVNLLAEQENTEMLRLISLLCRHAGIEINNGSEEALEQETKPDEIIRQIERNLGMKPIKPK